MVIVKSRDFTGGWVVYSEPVGNTKYLYLDTTSAEVTDSGRFNDTTPTASVFTLGDDGYVNQSGNTLIAYCIHSVEGYSKVGSFVGNGVVDGPFVYTGFEPTMIIAKCSSATSGWDIVDSERDPYNGVTQRLYPQDAAVEETASPPVVDFLSNGFKVRTTSGNWNTNSGTQIYLAFAESPFKTSNAR